MFLCIYRMYSAAKSTNINRRTAEIDCLWTHSIEQSVITVCQQTRSNVSEIYTVISETRGLEDISNSRNNYYMSLKIISSRRV